MSAKELLVIQLVAVSACHAVTRYESDSANDARPPDAVADLATPDSDSALSDFVPSNIPGWEQFLVGDAALEIGSDGNPVWVFDTRDGSIRSYSDGDFSSISRKIVRMATPDGGVAGGTFFVRALQRSSAAEVTAPALGIFSFSSLDIPIGSRLVGVGDAALVLLSQRYVRVEGLLTVGGGRGPTMVAGGALGGAPANEQGSGPAEVGAGPGGGLGGGGSVSAGWGGGGGGTFGGLGGAATVRSAASLAGTPGAVYGAPDLVPLVGGSGGGGGTYDARGGASGGALQLVARLSIEVLSVGRVGACGAGGQSATSNAYHGGGGGGSGGAILIEAPRVAIAGAIGANGGGGGSSPSGEDGAHGRPDAPRAAGAGGLGGDGSDELGVGADGRPTSVGGNGGGGGAGRIRINAFNAVRSLFLPHVLPRSDDLFTVGQPAG